MDEGNLDNVVEVGDIVYQTKNGPDEGYRFVVLEVTADGKGAKCRILDDIPENDDDIVELAVPWITKVSN